MNLKVGQHYRYIGSPVPYVRGDLTQDVMPRGIAVELLRFFDGTAQVRAEGHLSVVVGADLLEETVFRVSQKRSK